MTSILSDGVGSLRLAEIVILCSKTFGSLKIADEDYKTSSQDEISLYFKI